METLAYLHAACAYESAPSAAPEQTFDDTQSIAHYTWGRLSSLAVLRLLPLTVGLLVISLTNAAIAATLQRGDTGAEVSALQEKLSRLGYFEGPQTGYFGTLTQEAVLRFQRENGLSADGVYGLQTQQLLEQKASSPQVGTQNCQYCRSPAQTERTGLLRWYCRWHLWLPDQNSGHQLPARLWLEAGWHCRSPHLSRAQWQRDR